MTNALALRPEYPFINQILHTDLFTLCKSLSSQSVDMILCDLPYGTTACAWDEIIPLEPMWAEFKRVIKPRGAVVLTAMQPFSSVLVYSNVHQLKYEWVWRKTSLSNFLNAHKMPMRAHEAVLVFGENPFYFPQKRRRDVHSRNTNGKPALAYGSHLRFGNKSVQDDNGFPHSLLEFNSLNHAYENVYHPTQKPVALFEYLIRTYTQENEIVLDPCVGSGTTALAAMRTNRRCICGDITEEYVNIARQRLQNADPYQPTVKAEGVVQHSLFATV